MKAAAGYRNARVLITGASGFIGRRLAAALSAAKAKLTCLDINASGKTAIKCDLAAGAAARRAINAARPDYIFHLAALTGRDQDTALLPGMLAANLAGAYNLFECARALPRLRGLVVFGTAEEYGPRDAAFVETMGENPVGPYSFSKVCVTNLARLYFNLYRLPVTVLRPTLAYGPGQPPTMFLPALLTALGNDKPFPMTAGRQTRDFVYVDDLVEAALLAGQSVRARGEIFNIGSNQPVQIAKAARMAAKLLGKEGLLRIGAKSYRKSELMCYRAEISKAAKLLGWKPQTTFKDGLRLTAESFINAGK